MPTEVTRRLRADAGVVATDKAARRRGTIGRLIDGLAAINGVVATFLFTALTLVVALQVASRFVLHIPIIWSEELARFLFFWVVLLGAAMSVKTRRHFVIDVAPSEGRAVRWRNVRFALDTVPHLCILGFSLLLLTEGIGYTRIGLLRTATNSQINMALVYAAIPVFAALSAIYSAGNLVLDCVAFARGEEPPRRSLQDGE